MILSTIFHNIPDIFLYFLAGYYSLLQHLQTFANNHYFWKVDKENGEKNLVLYGSIFSFKKKKKQTKKI